MLKERLECLTGEGGWEIWVGYLFLIEHEVDFVLMKILLGYFLCNFSSDFTMKKWSGTTLCKRISMCC